MQWKHRKTSPNRAILTRERWINPENCAQKITLAEMREKEWRGNRLYSILLFPPDFMNPT